MLARTCIAVLATCLAVPTAAHSEEIEEIFVTAARRAVDSEQLSASLDVIAADVPGESPLLTDALADAVGVQLQQTTPGQGAAIVRGQKGSAVLHMVDGMRLNNAIFRSAPTQYLALVPALAVEQVEILRGTPTSLYGSDAIGGVIQVVTRRPEFDSDTTDLHGEVMVSANSAESARVAGATLDAGNRRFVSSFSAELADIGDRRIGGGDEILPSAWRSKAARWLFLAQPDDTRDVGLDLHWFEQPKTPRSDELVPGFGQTAPSSSEFWFRPNRRLFVHLDYESREGPLGLDWKVDTAWQRIDDDRQTREFGASDRLVERNQSDLYGLTINASRLTSVGSWIAGVDLYHDDVSSQRISEDVFSGQRTIVTSRFPDGSSMQLMSAYGNSTWAVSERHAVTLGARVSDVRTRLPAAQVHNTELSGDLGWVALVNERWQITGNIGYGFRAPNIFDLGTLGNRPGNRFNVPNTGLDSERVIHGDIGFRYRTPGARVEVAGFVMRYRDRITSVTTGATTPEGRDITQSVNAATTDVHGIEAAADLQLGDHWQINTNLTWTWAEQRVQGSSREPGDRVPPLNGVLAIAYDADSRWQATAWVRFSAGQSRLSNRDVGDARIDPTGTPGWASVGARAGWRPAENWTLSLSLSNAFDSQYRVHGSGIDAVGRNLAATVRRRF